MSYILALDQGTTSSRAIVFDAKGRIKKIAQKEFRQIFPQVRPEHTPKSGDRFSESRARQNQAWVEHEARDIWSTQVGVAQEAITGAGLRASDIAAIGITNQRETTVIWDRATGQPIHNAIVWQDRRTAGICDALRAAGHEPVFQQKTGLLLDAYFSGTKIKWLLDNVEGARAKAERGDLAFGTIDSWLVWNLTGGALHITDASNASRTLLYNLHTGDWDNDLLGLLDIPRALLPEVRSNSEVYGTTAEGLFGARIPIAGMAGDQQAATFGQVCHERGMAKNTYGTGCFMLMNTGSEIVPSANKLLTTLAWDRGGKTFALEGSVFVAGALVQWLRDGLGIIRSSSEIEALAAQVADTDGVCLVPAFVGLGAPHWDAYARGTLIGLTRGTTKAHIARAALEAIAFQSADVLEAMQRDAAIGERIPQSGNRFSDTDARPLLKELRVDGGASANNLMMQFQADILGVPVVRPTVTETTALGAAYLAGLAVGYWADTDELRGLWQVDRVFEPRMSDDERAVRLSVWRKAVERSKGWTDA